ncbi:hypothetical protein [Nostoc linckia]|uniref:hypothetical protein n=1 Tax=Nostoc linckia TaxID=92942 RepID=UPI00117E0CA0|nr:hypothetical protein [Nostoc linckia]
MSPAKYPVGGSVGEEDAGTRGHGDAGTRGKMTKEKMVNFSQKLFPCGVPASPTLRVPASLLDGLFH